MEENFEEKVKSGVTLVDFFASWCGPCRTLAPILEKILKELKEKVTLLKIDVDENQKIPDKLRVTSVPTLILYKDGKELKRLSGIKDEEALKIFINSAF